ncbi:MAG: hypothetical protein JF595_12305 [Sphingomonadales bacterium]|nr:hypothetical protein [Sphingomonadales bacterium]
MVLRTIAVIAAAALVASAAPARERPRASGTRECFQLSAVSGYTHARNDRLYVHTGPRDTYLFKTMGSCPDLDWSEAIALDPATAGPICTGLDVDLIVPSTIGPRRCPVSMIRKLAPGEKEQR